MASIRVLHVLAAMVIWCAMINSATCFNLWGQRAAPTGDNPANTFGFLGRDAIEKKQAEIYYERRGRVIRSLPWSMFVWGILGVIGARIGVWLIGFGLRGVRKNTLAANLVKNHQGRVPPNSWLATMQSIGAGGLGWRRGFKVFLFSAVICAVFMWVGFWFEWMVIKRRMQAASSG